MKLLKLFISLAVFIIFIFCYIRYSDFFTQSGGIVVRDCHYSTDAQAVERLFYKDDNLYWLILGGTTYDVMHMLKNKSSSQYASLNDLIIKVATIDQKVVGFVAYYKISPHVWRFLFLIVDQDYRKQGVAKKLLKYSMDDMVKHHATQIILLTRTNNFKAQNLYKNFGFKIVSSEDLGVWMTWHK